MPSPRMPEATPIENMIEALGLEIEAIKRSTSSSAFELRGGRIQQTVGANTLYSFPLAEEPTLRDDSPVKIVILGKEVNGSVVSIRNGILTLAIAENLGPEIPFARLVVNDSYLVERMRDKLVEIQAGLVTFNTKMAEAVLSNGPDRVAEAPVPDAVFTHGDLLNVQQQCAVRKSLGSSLLYLWGPPGTGKTLTLGAIVHAHFLAGKSVLVVSNTNIAVDTALERIADRLAPLPEFNEAAVLRFGQIASETLKAKYGSHVDIDKAVERHAGPLTQRQNSLRNDASRLQDIITTHQHALADHQWLADAQGQRQHLLNQRQQLSSDLARRKQALAGLTEQTRLTQWDLQRCRSMGAIRRFFAGFNEEHLKRTLSQTRLGATNNEESCIQIEQQIIAVDDKVAHQDGEIQLCTQRLQLYPNEPMCRTELDHCSERLDAIVAEIKAIDEQLTLLKESLLKNCRVLATTVYQSYLRPEIGREYDVVVVDEASMLLLPMVYYAAGLAKEKVIVAGDFRQLPPIVISDKPLCHGWLKRDVFFSAGIAAAVGKLDAAPPASLVTLTEQFRMQEDICVLVNSVFYGNRLTTSPRVRGHRSRPRPFTHATKGLLFVDTSAWGSWAAFKLGTYSRYNVDHARLVRAIAVNLRDSGYIRPSSTEDDRLGIVSPYNAQCRLIGKLIEEGIGVRGSVYARTVHRFQGSERDTMICDVTDSTGVIPSRFVRAQAIEEDGARLLNVALSRARLCTVLIANFKYLRDKLPSRACLRQIINQFERNGEALDVSGFFSNDAREILSAHQAATSTVLAAVDNNPIQVFSEGTFYPAFEADCSRARKDIVIFSPFMTGRGTGRWVDLWRAKIAEGVRVRIVTRPPGDQGGSLEVGLVELIDNLRVLGVVVDERTRMHEKLGFVDQEVLWHGSLNILSHRDTSESMLRMYSPGACEQVGSFVVGRKRRGNGTDVLAEEENPHCTNCARPMVWNTGRHGVWFQCECGEKADEYGRPRRRKPSTPQSASPMGANSSPDLGSCPNCGKPLVQKEGRYGSFIGCTDYQQCRYIADAQTRPHRRGPDDSKSQGGMTADHAKLVQQSLFEPASSPLFVDPSPLPVPRTVAKLGPEESGSAPETGVILGAFSRADDSLGLLLLSVKTKIGQRRLEAILPQMVQSGLLKQSGSGRNVRYSRDT